MSVNHTPLRTAGDQAMQILDCIALNDEDSPSRTIALVAIVAHEDASDLRQVLSLLELRMAQNGRQLAERVQRLCDLLDSMVLSLDDVAWELMLHRKPSAMRPPRRTTLREKGDG